MSIRYNMDTKEQAKGLFMHGESFAHIARVLGCYEETVSQWSRNGCWPEEKARVNAAAAATANQKGIDMSANIDGQLQAYIDMLNIGNRALHQIKVKSAGEAAQLIDRANKGIKELTLIKLQLTFIVNITEVLKSEITDRDILLRIGEKFRAIYEKYKS